MESKRIDYSPWLLKPYLPSEVTRFFKYRDEDVKENFQYWLAIYLTFCVMVIIDFVQNFDLRTGIVVVHATAGGALHFVLWYNRDKAKDNFSSYLAILIWYMSL